MKKTILFAASLTLMLSACNQDTAEPRTEGEAFTKLKVNVFTEAQTRAMIEETTLADGSEVAFSVLEDGNEAYDGFETYKNVRFTASTSGASQIWTPDADILLSTTLGTLYAYYPYSSAVTDITAVPVEATSAVQTDYMYGTPVPGLNNKNATADMILNHALAGVRLNIVKGTFSGTGLISEVAVNGQAIATSAKMNSLTGVLSGFAGQDTRIAPAFTPFTVNTTATMKDFIVIPTGSSATMTISIKIDGLEIQATTPAVDFAEGTITSYTVTVNSKALEVTSVSVTPWGSANGGDIDIL